MSEEVALAIGDLAELRRALEVAQAENDQHQALNARLLRELVIAHADVVALRHAITIALPTIGAFGDSQIDMVAEHLEVWRDKPFPGAQLLVELEAARAVVAAMRQIDRHVVGAYETESGSVEPCDECGEMRDIAQQALARYDAATKAPTSNPEYTPTPDNPF